MKSTLKYFVLLFCLNFIEGSFRCDYKYSFLAKAWFKHFVVPATWSDARLRCALEGAALASPTTLKIKTEMMNLIRDSALKQEVFTGIHATLSQGDYHTVEGTPLLKIPVVWAADEPDNKNNMESCLTLNSNGEVADRSCEGTRPYICYRPDNSQVEANECGTIDPAYRLDVRTNKCYKFHLEPRNFSRASFACMAEGGHLAVINSDTEATVLRELFATIDKNDMLGMPESWKNAALIGFYDWGEHGEWRTVHGQTLSEAGYSRWNSGEPTTTEGEFCGSLWRNGYLNDVWCDKNFSFICEKDPQYPGVCRADQPSFIKDAQSQCG
uniref:IML18 n=1 Tax=Mythimna separata TaxID=271217 RepID=A0A8F3HLS5_MYTSE|nr:IML18 [Mythimna separata]